MWVITPLLGLFWCGLATPLGIPDQGHRPFEPNHQSARDNAHRIFNAIHSAGRQWGSSLNHNGFGFIPAIVPKGTLLYHGTRYDKPPSVPEWLAFEIEHSEIFAASYHLRSQPRHPHNDLQPEADLQEPLALDDPLPKPANNSRGYLHTYQANRDLNLLYIDGSAAAKTTMGTLDSQDLVLLENSTAGHRDLFETERALALCDLATRWGYDGLMRMEMGFEIIYCDFSHGLSMISALRTFLQEDRLEPDDMQIFHWSRAAGERYDGLKDRVRLDFSSMSSGFFFPLNLSSINPRRPDLIRLGANHWSDLKILKNHIQHISAQPRRFIVDWQAVVDMVVARFSNSLALMGWDGTPEGNFVTELERTTLTFVDAPPLPGDFDQNAEATKNKTLEAVERCTGHFLLPTVHTKNAWSFEDELIHTALSTVLGEICNDLFAIRSSLLQASSDTTTHGYRVKLNAKSDNLKKAVEKSREILRSLMQRLAWTDWKKTRPCQPDEVMFVAMWPVGTEEDHWQPGCRTINEMRGRRSGYWSWV